MSGVSVCIPCFNGERFIAQAIESVLNQTVRPQEIIVYDDGSTDSSVEIASKYKVRVVMGKRNRGIGFARRRLVEEAGGTHTCFISADDTMKPNYIEEMLSASKSNPNSILYCDYTVMGENGEFIKEVVADTYEHQEDWIMANIFHAKGNTMSVCYNIFAPTKTLKENNFDATLRYGEDLEHLLRCTLVKRISYFHIAKPLFNYRTHLMATTTTEMKGIPKNNNVIFRKINRMMKREVL